VGTQGNPWKPHILKRLLESRTIAALRERDGKVYAGQWPAIVPPEEWRRLSALFRRRSAAWQGSTARRYVLTGFERCGTCESRMVANKRDGESRRYVCRKFPGTPACGGTSIVADPLEALVFEMIVAAVDDGSLRRALEARTEPSDGLLEAVQRDEEALNALTNDFYVERLLSREEFLTARAALNARLDLNRQKLARQSGRGLVMTAAAGGESLRGTWETASLEWRRALLGAVVDTITITKPTVKRGFDPLRAVVAWRF
jgi:site-specific DNA recombinase